MEFTTFTLANGIRCIHRRVHSGVVHCALVVNAGSRDELPTEHGVAHLAEHTLFKGTLRRKAYQINSRLEKLGGELNAFTTKEDTTIHATTLRSDFAKAVDLIADVVFHSTFPSHEVEREKKVVIDEINTYRDLPAESIFDEFEALLFPASSLGRPILGTRRSVGSLGSEQIRNFLERTYTTDQMVFSSIGPMSEETVRRTAERFLGTLPVSKRSFERTAPEATTPFFKQTHKLGNHQGHCIVGGRAFGFDDKRRLPLAMLVNLLGGPSANARLNVLLRERNGLSYNIEAAYVPFTDTGEATIYFSSEKEQVDRCLELVQEELHRAMEKPLSSRQLAQAKKQFLGQFAISMESNEGYMLGAGKSFLVYNEVDTLKEVCRKVHEVTAEELAEVARTVFAEPSVLIYR